MAIAKASWQAKNRNDPSKAMIVTNFGRASMPQLNQTLQDELPSEKQKLPGSGGTL